MKYAETSAPELLVESSVRVFKDGHSHLTCTTFRMGDDSVHVLHPFSSRGMNLVLASELERRTEWKKSFRELGSLS